MYTDVQAQQQNLKPCATCMMLSSNLPHGCKHCMSHASLNFKHRPRRIHLPSESFTICLPDFIGTTVQSLSLSPSRHKSTHAVVRLVHRNLAHHKHSRPHNSQQAAAAVTGSELRLPLIAVSCRHNVLLLLLTPTPPNIAATHPQGTAQAALMQQ
jgi:hypothetical protein